MKIIHTSDLHLNSKMDKLSSIKANVRREELLRTFERLIDYAKVNGVSAIIISGDLFDTTKISSKVYNRVMHSIVNASDIDFLYLPGNHEQASFISMIEQIPENLKIFNSSWQYFRYGNVVISGIAIDKANSKILYDTCSFNSEDINIVSLHGQVAGYKTSDSEDLISIPLFRNKSIDYLALGHYHSFAQGNIDERGKYVYCGCLEGRGFDETGDKGFVLIDTDDKLSYQFVKFAYRTLFEENIDVTAESNYLDFRNKLLDRLTSEISQDSLVKVVLVGEHPTTFDVDELNLSTLLNEKFFYAKVEDDTSLLVDIKDYELDKSYRGEFVRAVLNSDLDEKEKQLVIKKGLKALKGEI